MAPKPSTTFLTLCRENRPEELCDCINQGLFDPVEMMKLKPQWFDACKKYYNYEIFAVLLPYRPYLDNYSIRSLLNKDIRYVKLFINYYLDGLHDDKYEGLKYDGYSCVEWIRKKYGDEITRQLIVRNKIKNVFSYSFYDVESIQFIESIVNKGQVDINYDSILNHSVDTDVIAYIHKKGIISNYTDIMYIRAFKGILSDSSLFIDIFTNYNVNVDEEGYNIIYPDYARKVADNLYGKHIASTLIFLVTNSRINANKLIQIALTKSKYDIDHKYNGGFDLLYYAFLRKNTELILTILDYPDIDVFKRYTDRNMNLLFLLVHRYVGYEYEKDFLKIYKKLYEKGLNPDDKCIEDITFTELILEKDYTYFNIYRDAIVTIKTDLSEDLLDKILDINIH